MSKKVINEQQEDFSFFHCLSLVHGGLVRQPSIEVNSIETVRAVANLGEGRWMDRLEISTLLISYYILVFLMLIK